MSGIIQGIIPQIDQPNKLQTRVTISGRIHITISWQDNIVEVLVTYGVGNEDRLLCRNQAWSEYLSLLSSPLVRHEYYNTTINYCHSCFTRKSTVPHLPSFFRIPVFHYPLYPISVSSSRSNRLSDAASKFEAQFLCASHPLISFSSSYSHQSRMSCPIDGITSRNANAQR